MMDREKVISKLHILRTWCAVNPDYDTGLSAEDCVKAVGWLDDALAMLIAQEPRVMTLEEVLGNAQKIGFPCWVEDHIEDIGPAFLFPAVITSDDAYVQYTGNAYYEGAIYHRDYNKRLRCWTSRPTDEQREATPWQTR